MLTQEVLGFRIRRLTCSTHPSGNGKTLSRGISSQHRRIRRRLSQWAKVVPGLICGWFIIKRELIYIGNTFHSYPRSAMILFKVRGAASNDLGVLVLPENFLTTFCRPVRWPELGCGRPNCRDCILEKLDSRDDRECQCYLRPPPGHAKPRPVSISVPHPWIRTPGCCYRSCPTVDI